MSRKKRTVSDAEPPGSKRTSRRSGGKRRVFSVFGISGEGNDPDILKQHILYLGIVSVLVKFIVLFATAPVFHSFIDNFDFQYYLQSATNIAQGQIPYVNFGFDYPPLAFVPIFLAFVPALLLNSAGVFVLFFQLQMVLWDVITVVCVYLIGLKLYREKTAFTAALLYATAFSGAYFVLTKYDAFPVSLLMLAVLFLVYNRAVLGYASLILGFFVKIFPAIALPFAALYHAKSGSLRQEIVAILKIGIPVSALFLIPVLILKPDFLLSYVSGSLVRTDVYVNTATYTLYTYLHDVFGLGVNATAVSAVLYLAMGLVLVLTLAAAWAAPNQEPRQLIRFLLVALFTVVFCMKYHSPQYALWFTPLVCLLVADSLSGIVLFYTVQGLSYLEFPLLFGTLYVNGEYLSPAGSHGWYVTLLFFTLAYAASLLLVYRAVNPTGKELRALWENLKAARKNAG